MKLNAQPQAYADDQFSGDDRQIIEGRAGIFQRDVPLRRHDQERHDQRQKNADLRGHFFRAVKRRRHHQPAHPRQHQGEDQKLFGVDLVEPVHEGRMKDEG